MNKAKAKEIFIKVEIWIDFSNKTKLDKYETQEEQDKVFNALKQGFIDNLTSSMKRTIDPQNEIKFEYHQKEHSGHHHGGGYRSGGGGYRKKNYGGRNNRGWN